MNEKDNMNEKDKLFRTIRRLLVIGAISIAAIYILLFVLNFIGR